jgi:hypothetical protein
MRAKWLEYALAVSGLPASDEFPRDLKQEILLSIPLTLVELPRLSTALIRSWLSERNVVTPVHGTRRLHGALVAHAGAGVVFIDSDDDAQEKRFSLAHETAHFIHDHMVPRALAIRVFGEELRPVLDGRRAPTRDESLSAVLRKVPLGPQVHLMTRSETGSIVTWAVEEREQRADRLALELLAPLHVFSSAARTTTPETLAQRFGLPKVVVGEYLELIRQPRRRRSLADTLRQAR